MRSSALEAVKETVVGDGRRMVRWVGGLSIVKARGSLAGNVSGTKLKIGGRSRRLFTPYRRA